MRNPDNSPEGQALNTLRVARNLCRGKPDRHHHYGICQPTNSTDLKNLAEMLDIYVKQARAGLTCMMLSHLITECKALVEILDERSEAIDASNKRIRR